MDGEVSCSLTIVVANWLQYCLPGFPKYEGLKARRGACNKCLAKIPPGSKKRFQLDKDCDMMLIR